MLVVVLARIQRRIPSGKLDFFLELVMGVDLYTVSPDVYAVVKRNFQYHFHPMFGKTKIVFRIFRRSRCGELLYFDVVFNLRRFTDCRTAHLVNLNPILDDGFVSPGHLPSESR